MGKNNKYKMPQKQHRQMMNYGMDVQRDPYSNILSQQEKQLARNLPFRMFFNCSSAALVGLYYMSRHDQIGRAKAFRITLDVALNVFGRSLITFGVADQVSRRFFVNYMSMKKHQIA